MTEVQLRDYQQDSIEQIREHYRQGHKRVILQLPTGAGKTTCFSYMLGRAAERGVKCVMVVRGKDLVDQASKRLFDCGINNHGVLQGNHWNYKPEAPIQVCSIDTLSRRGIFPEAGFIVIDECHRAGSKSFRDFINNPQYAKSNFLSVSATPHIKGGSGFLATKVVNPIGVDGLIKKGFLVKPRYYAVPNKIEQATLKFDKVKQDYTQASLLEAVEKAKILGDAVENYLRYGENRPAIYFAVNVELSKKAAEQFNYAGVAAEHVDANTKPEDRAAVLSRLKSGETKVITNCEVYTTGVDIPCVGAIILARPTASYNLYVQMCGRGTRPYPGKKDFFIFDHANNVMEHGFIEDEKECSLDGEEKPRKVSARTCQKCYAVYQLVKICPYCGFTNVVEEKEKSEINIDKSYELVEIKDKEVFYDKKIEKFLRDGIKIVIFKKLKRGFLYHYLRKEYGINKATEILKNKRSFIDNELTKRGWVEPQRESRPPGQINLGSTNGD